MEDLEAKLKAQLEVYQQIFKTCEVATIIIDEKGNRLDYNDSFMELFEYESQNDVPLTIPNKFSPEFQFDGKKTLDKAKEVITIALSVGHYEVEWLHKKTNNDTFRSHVVIDKIIFDGKTALKIKIKDVTAQRELERKVNRITKSIQEQKELLRSVLDHHPNPIVLKNYEGKFVLVNEAVAKLYNTSIENMIGKDDGDFIDDMEIAEGFRRNVQEIMQSGQSQIVYEDSYDVRLGEKRHYMSIKKPFINTKGEKNILVIANDITEVTKANKILKEKDRLLFQQSKMAAMGEMIGNIAHQWRQPLSMVSTLATGVKLRKELDTISRDEELDSLDKINEIVQHLSTTIDDFRDFFRPEKKTTNFTLQDIINKVFSLISAQLSNNNIQVVKTIDNIEIKTLENQLIQVLLNIFNNARDALNGNKNLEEKFIFVDIKEIDGKIYINIKDNAGGIDDKIIDRIFEPYFTTKHESQGTGIGLYMSEEMIVKNMYGEIFVTNDEYSYNNKALKGAKFSIILPKN